MLGLWVCAITGLQFISNDGLISPSIKTIWKKDKLYLFADFNPDYLLSSLFFCAFKAFTKHYVQSTRMNYSTLLCVNKGLKK
jgi:hypothetical protein